MMLKGFSKTKPSVPSKFKKFDIKISSKSRGRKTLESMIKKNSLLRKTIDGVFSKKGLFAIGTTAAIGIGVSKIHEYIEANSGCFLQGRNDVCKMRSLSCCQNGAVQGVEFCQEPVEQANQLKNVCDGFDEDDPTVQESCCLLCDCRTYGGCLPGESMECRRPTVAEAISFYTQSTMSGLTGWMWKLIPVWIIFGIVALLFGFTVIKLYLYLRRRNNKDA